MQLESKTVLVAGGSSGLGAACVEALLFAKANVLNLDLAPPNQPARGSSFDRLYYQRADVANEDEVRRAIENGEAKLGPLAAAVVCAGILHCERSLGLSGPAPLKSFQKVIQTNLVGTYNVVCLAAEAIARGNKKLVPTDSKGFPMDEDRGAIVMTSSIAAFEGQVGQSAYAASKGGVASMTLPLARDLSVVGIRVVTIAPGVFETPMMQAASSAVRDELIDCAIFPKRFGQPNEFASTVLHVLQNSMYNGCTIRLDGAMRLP